MCEVERHEVNGLRVVIEHDELVESPRVEWDNLTIMACFHRRYSLGDRPDVHCLDDDEFEGWADMESYIEREFKPVAMKPLYLYDHSGLAINTTGFSYCDSAGWDWGRLGLVWVPSDRMSNEFPSLTSKEAREVQAEKIIDAEVEAYNQFLAGDVYGYRVVKPCGECGKDGDILDSCGGIYGRDYCREEALAAARAIELEAV